MIARPPHVRALVAAVFLLGIAACGAGTSGPAASTTTPAKVAGPLLEARELGALGQGECSTKPYLAKMGAACVGQAARNAQNVGPESSAADGDACTVWNSGGMPPQSIIVDLEKETTLNGMLLVPEMTPPEGDVVHVIEQSNTGNSWTTVGVVKSHMADDHVYGVVFSAKIAARYLRVNTHTSPSWVSWAEVDPVLCN